MPAPQDGYIVWSGNGYSSYYHESDGIVASFNPSQTTISINQSNNSFPPDHGKIYRYLKQSREYVFELYNGNVPFNLPPIYTFLYDGNPQAAGAFCSTNNCTGLSAQPFGPYIYINPNSGSQIKTISHEYGHKVNFRMWNSSSNKMSNATLSVKEGWAEFFSFALRNYANRNYGDNLLSNRTNAEEAPFYTNRYAGFSYLGTDRKVAAFGSYLWSLYDDPQDDIFLSNTYSIGDNDDITGHSVRVFDAMSAIQIYYLNTIKISHFHNIFKLGLASEEQSSINNVFDFMFDDLYEMPDVSMRSAQVANFSGQVNGSNVDFSWLSQSYPSHLNFANIETGYRLYQSTGSGWNLIQSIPYGTNNFTYHSPFIYADYKITSYNSEGNSANAPVISIQPPTLFVSISGPTNMFQGSSDTFYANVSGGIPPYSYQWYYKHQYDSNWTMVPFATSSTYLHTAGSQPGEFVRVVVTDTAPQNKESEHHFTIIGWAFSQQETEDGGFIPETYALNQNYPNPFNPATVIRFDIPEQSDVLLQVFDVMGRHITTLESATKSAGRHTVSFNAAHLSSGMYIARLRATGLSGEVFIKELKMQLVK